MLLSWICQCGREGIYPVRLVWVGMEAGTDPYCCSQHSRETPVALVQIGNLQALAQFLSNASKSLSGTLADILSPSRMIIFGTLLTTLNKPMFAASGYMYATFGTVVTLYWVTAGTALPAIPQD